MEISSRLSSEIASLGEEVGQGTSALVEAKSSGEIDPMEAKRIIDDTARRMDRFATFVESQIGPFREAFGLAITSYGKAASLLGDFKSDMTEDLEGAIQTASELEHSIQQGPDALSGFEASVVGLPRATSALIRARKGVLSAIRALDREFLAALTSTVETRQLFEELATRFGSGAPGKA